MCVSKKKKSIKKIFKFYYYYIIRKETRFIITIIKLNSRNPGVLTDIFLKKKKIIKNLVGIDSTGKISYININLGQKY